MEDRKARRKAFLDEFIKDLEEEIFSQFDQKLDEESAQSIRQTIRERVLRDFQDETGELINRLKKSVTKEIASKVTRDEKLKKKAEEEEFQRFNLHFRIQHIMIFTSVIILILTGLPLKFPDLPTSTGFVSIIGGIKSSRLLHRIGAVILIAAMAYHVIYSILHREGRRDLILLIPRPRDFLNLIQNIKYFLGFSHEKARFGRFSYIEKFDYWAVYWGCVVMIGTGAILWFENLFLNIFPKYMFDISKEAHSDEALLATLAIVIWHFYNVHLNPDIFPMSWTWWTGKISKEEMIEHHPLEYEETTAENAKDDAM
ncbi:MAG: cytochrome b/b6 domain-containing protein [Deltaproteobacteria bacterium]|nr:MAG: cytochrome b/b6 domain-containing protein [Deltaproteobacteria bacterium]